jgi:16S rRNA (uracil1498-N3)-methyltransferase
VSGDRLVLDAEESHHLLHVHRAGPGTPFDAVDGTGVAYRCEIRSVERGLAVGAIVSRTEGSGELPAALTLIVGLPDPGPAETIVSIGVPLGLTAIDFAGCARSARPPLSDARIERLLRVARSALKQSRRTRMPLIRSSRSLAQALGLLAPGARWVAEPGAAPFASRAGLGPEPAVAISVGPPGGFDERESAALREAGFEPISLGPSRLTTETAAVTLTVLARNQLLLNAL